MSVLAKQGHIAISRDPFFLLTDYWYLFYFISFIFYEKHINFTSVYQKLVNFWAIVVLITGVSELIIYWRDVI